MISGDSCCSDIHLSEMAINLYISSSIKKHLDGVGRIMESCLVIRHGIGTNNSGSSHRTLLLALHYARLPIFHPKK